MSRTCGDRDVASGRDSVAGAYGFFARYVLLPWQSCLDVGGGLGLGLQILRRRSRRVRAIDVDPRLRSFGVETGRIEDQADGSADWVLAVDVVEHVEDDETFLKQLGRVGRRGVFVTTPNLDHHPGRAWPYHVREYTLSAFLELCRRCWPDMRLRQFVADALGGGFAASRLDASREHQAVLACRGRSPVASAVLELREWALRRRRFRGIAPPRKRTKA